SPAGIDRAYQPLAAPSVTAHTAKRASSRWAQWGPKVPRGRLATNQSPAPSSAEGCVGGDGDAPVRAGERAALPPQANGNEARAERTSAAASRRGLPTMGASASATSKASARFTGWTVRGARTRFNPDFGSRSRAGREL